MDFRLSEVSEHFRAEVRSFLDLAMTEELEERLYREGVSDDDDFTQELLRRGWLFPEMPDTWGGEGRDALEVLTLHEELQRAEAPVYSVATNAMVIKVILAVGSSELQERLLRDALNGRIKFVLGFSEPETGSDVAAVATKAQRDGDQWVISGQKMFTTNAQIGDYVFLLARTDGTVAKHRGLTMFLVPLDSPGIEIQGVTTLSGERTNITFYNDVHVTDLWRIGDIDAGWQTLTVALQHEHSSTFGPHIARLLELVEKWARETTDDTGRRKIDDPSVRARLARAATSLEISTLLHRRAWWMEEVGDIPEAEGPMSKLFSSEALVRSTQDLWQMMGPDALRSYLEPTAPLRGKIEHLMRFSLGTTIYAGTSEIQRNIIAQRGLKLPR
jgi:3-oxocholest-4-en-26-oyl-CoA dehydrogenase alpha subunit